MATKKKGTPAKRHANSNSSKPVSEKTFLHYVELLESKIDYSRKDTAEQMSSIAKGMNSRMDGMDLRMDGMNSRMDGMNSRMDRVESELRQTQQAIRSTKEELRSEVKATETHLSSKIDFIHTRFDDHEVRITAIEKAS